MSKMKLHKGRPVIWQPNPGPQEFALGCTEYEILFGGSRGGGKTDAGLAFMTYDTENPRYRGLVIRKNAQDLSDWVDRARMMYTPMGAAIVGSQKPEIRWSKGGVIRTGHLKDENAYEQYQGHEYHKVLIEELTQIPDENSYLKLISSARSTVPDLDPQIFATTNPGGRGHVWVRKRFVDPHPEGSISFPDPKSGRMRIFIRATVDDTPQLMKNDPGYVQFLESLPENLMKAWRHGDWDILAGNAFPEWDMARHVVPHFDPAPGVKLIRATDYGRNAPFATYWGAVDWRGSVYWYREYYVKGRDADENAYNVSLLSAGEKYWIDVIDPSVFAEAGHGHTIAEILKANGMPNIEPATRQSKKWRLHRKVLYHEYLRWDAYHPPMMIFSSQCKNAIRTIPELGIDEKNPEDLDTDGEDHAWDATSYGLNELRERTAPAPSVEENRKKLMGVRRGVENGLFNPNSAYLK